MIIQIVHVCVSFSMFSLIKNFFFVFSLSSKPKIMPCFSNFCCGYGLRSGGSFIGYFSIIIYVKFSVISVIFWLNINNRIDESEGNSNASILSQLSSAFRVKSAQDEIESFVGELKSENQNVLENIFKLYVQFAISRYFELFLLPNPYNNLKVYSLILIFYLLFLMFGILCASFLITGAKLVSLEITVFPVCTLRALLSSTGYFPGVLD